MGDNLYSNRAGEGGRPRGTLQWHSSTQRPPLAFKIQQVLAAEVRPACNALY